jgi:hypothetical protein
MRSFKNWRIKEATENADWNHMKAMKFPANPDIKAFVAPRIGKIQEAIVQKLAEGNPKVKSFRDVPPEIRDQFAQAIVSSTLELFFGGMDPGTPSSGQQPAPAPKGPSPQPMLPQDEPKAPSISGGM